MTEPEDLPGTTIAGCRVIKKIGQGGMGAVYTADHLTLGKLVCVKILSPDLAKDGRNIEFFMREARSAAKLEHPNIVRVYSFGQEQGLHYIVMSYIEGSSLADIIAGNGPMDTNKATDIMLEVFDALKHAHSKAIIHRDIKPSNILLGSDGRPSIVDFGLARSISEEKLLTMAGEMIGTAYFMSPEQGLAGKVDHRADLYSAGATFFYLLTGKYPFEGKTYIEVVHKHIGEPLPSIIVLKPDLPLWVSRVLDLLMRKNPKDRYQDAAQVIEDIKRLREAEKNGASATIELPELSKRLAEENAARAREEERRSEEAPGETPAPPAAESGTGTGTAAASSSPGAAKALDLLKRALPASGDALKLFSYCAVTCAAAACFLLAGAAGAAEPGMLRSLRMAFSTNPSSFLLSAGLGLIALSVFFRPLRSTVARVVFLSIAGLAAYACAAYAPPASAGASAPKTAYLFELALSSAMSRANFPVYTLCLFIAASKLAIHRHWSAKAASAAAYLASLAFTFVYLGGGLPAELPQGNYPAMIAAAALAGTASALTQKRFALFFSAPLLFLAANAMTAAMFTAPHIDAVVERSLAIEAGYDRQRGSRGYMDVDFNSEGEGNAESDRTPIREFRSPTRKELKKAATLAYYRTLAARMERNVLRTAGLLLLSLFMLMMANLLYLEAVRGIHAEEGGEQ